MDEALSTKSEAPKSNGMHAGSIFEVLNLEARVCKDIT